MIKSKITNNTLVVKCPYCEKEHELSNSLFDESLNKPQYVEIPDDQEKILYYTSQIINKPPSNNFLINFISVMVPLLMIPLLKISEVNIVDFNGFNIKSIGFFLFFYLGTMFFIKSFFKYIGFIWLYKCGNCDKQICISKRKSDFRVYTTDEIGGIELPLDEKNEALL